MTLKELKERALISADEIGNESEYEEQLIEAINKVQNKLLVFAKNKYKYTYVLARRGRGNDIRIKLPEDCFELVEVRDEYLNIIQYNKINNQEIQVPSTGTYQLKYKAFLPNVTKDTEEDYVIDIDPIAESCMVVGVASWIAIDNPELYDVLNNEYNNLLVNLSQMTETVGEMTGGIERIGGWYW